MKERKIVYCEMDFLLSFLKNRPVDDDFDDYREECWKGLGRFLIKSDLIVDVTKEVFLDDCESNTNNADEERINSFLKSIIKKSSQGEINLSFKDKFVNIVNLPERNEDESVLNAVYLTTSDDAICQNRSRDYGVIALNNTSVYKCIHLFKDSGIAFPSRNNKKWDFLNTLNTGLPQLKCCNSMLIVDNYICSDSLDRKKTKVTFSYQDKIRYNLEPILKALLPEKLADGLEFEISIFSGTNNDENLENPFNNICSLIGKIRPNLKFSITLYNNVSMVFHDRTIVTNNAWISCLAGFDVFDKKGAIRKPTNVNVIFPFFPKDINWTNDAFLNFIKSAKKIIERYPEPGRNLWGGKERKNRIVSYYSKGEPEKAATVQQKGYYTKQTATERFSRYNSWG